MLCGKHRRSWSQKHLPSVAEEGCHIPSLPDCSEQSSQEQLSALEEKHCEQCLFTLLFTLKSIYLLMFKNT